MADTCKCNSEDKIPPNQLRFFRNCWFGNSDAITKSYTQIFKNLKKVDDDNSKKTTTTELAQNINYSKESMMSIGKKKYALKNITSSLLDTSWFLGSTRSNIIYLPKGISLFSKMGDKGEGGVKNLKKWVTSDVISGQPL